MKKSIKKFIKNKYFFIFAVLILIMLPSTLYMNSDKDDTMIITTIGIDKEDDKYNLTALAVIPKGSEDINSNLEVFQADGDNISEALDEIALDTGKKIGLAHCDCIIISQEIMDENITKLMDFFVRTANITTNATIVGTDSKANKLIEATKNSNNLLDLSLKNIVTYQEKNSLLNDITLEKFYRTHFTKSSTFYLPIISIDESKEESSQSGGGDNESSGNTSGGSSGTGGTSSQKVKIKNDSKIAVLEQGKFSRYLTEDEMFIYNLLSPNSKNIRIKVDDVNDEFVTNSSEIYQQVEKFILPIYRFIDDKPVVEYYIWLSIMIDEIISEENFSYASIDSLQNFLSRPVEDKIRNMIDEKLDSTVKTMNLGRDDILGLYEKFNAFHHGKWVEYINSLENQQEYLNNVKIDIKISLNYVI